MSDAPNLDTRLAALPRKVALPFRELLAAEQISADDASVILDAGELAGERFKLLAFAVGYLHLRANGVPVHDVIRMAKALRRPVNLAWTAKRWKVEHDRLSRAETLARLARESLAYDVSQFAISLPKRFPGYLIRTSRRLGMEGLRQRHCVASYHDQLAAGGSAIAAVIVDRKRWTVQIAATGDSGAPLRIVQIKARLNELPSVATRERIHALLGIERAMRATEVGGPGETHVYMDNLRRLLPVLREHAVTNVMVSFDGSGDSGSIGDISYDAPPGFDPAELAVERMRVEADFEDGRWVRTVQLARTPIRDAIEDLTNDYLAETDIDWYNNDGGYGELEIDVVEGTVRLEVNVRYVNSSNEFDSERDIMTGEEV